MDDCDNRNMDCDGGEYALQYQAEGSLSDTRAAKNAYGQRSAEQTLRQFKVGLPNE